MEGTPMMTPDQATGQDDRAAAIAGLRELADLLESNPAIPADRYGWTFHTFPRADGDAAARAAVDQIAAALGVPVVDDTASAGHYVARRMFGPVEYSAVYIPDEARAAAAARESYAANIRAALPREDVAA
jgi:hypothetical protein